MSILLQVTDHLCDIVCGMCGLMSENHEAWDQHVAEVTLKEDADHASLLSAKMSSSEEKVILQRESKQKSYLFKFQITLEHFQESPQRRWPCPECRRFFATEEERNNHLVSVTTMVELVCPQCGELARDMEDHIRGHGGDVRCGECGAWVSDINSHMVDTHGGYTGVLSIQTVTCAGDGIRRVTRKISLRTSARFLATEVKPVTRESMQFLDKRLDVPLRPPPTKPFRNSERDKALKPPEILPDDFFDAEGNRIWSKMPSGAHQCELCGFKAVTKNKYREKQDHMAKWHFSKRLELIIPQNSKKPFVCPDCEYSGKDRQCVMRHYTGKHNVLDIWTNELLHAINNNALTPNIKYMVENVNFNPQKGRSVINDRPTNTNTSQIYSVQTPAQKPGELKLSFKKKRKKDMPVKRCQETGQPILKKIRVKSSVEEKGSVKTLHLQEMKDSGLFCVSCRDNYSGGNDEDYEDRNLLQSITELQSHIIVKHRDLIIKDRFVLVENTSAGPGRTTFTYYLCTQCGKCFSRTSPMEKLLAHVSQECESTNNNIEEDHDHDEEDHIVIESSEEAESEMIESIGNNNDTLAKLLMEISPSVSIYPKPAVSDTHLELTLSIEALNTKKRDPCPCEFCADPRFTDVKLHRCYVSPTCEKTFSKVAHLKAHIRSHNNERPYTCEWGGCGKTFVRSDELKRHAWIHTKVDR